MIPVPTVAQLAEFSGRPETSYTSYANSALLQACIIFVTVTEVGYGDASNTTDFMALNADDQLLANQGILAYSDWIYLRQPYQQMIANPAMSETIGSYSYSKPPPIQVRNVAAQELGIGSTGVELWDSAIQYLSKRTRANGVFFGQLECFENPNRNSADRSQMIVVRTDHETGNKVVLGPADFNRVDIPGFGVGINAPAFPGDPGI